MNFFLRLIRFPNLIIVALTQFLLQYLILVPAFRAAGVEPALDVLHFSMLVLSTLIIAAGGYIINDIVDYDIDVINKPERVIINRQLSMRQAYGLYYGLSLLGFFISLYLAFYVQNLPLVLIYPAAVLLLWSYSTYFKQRVLIGNVIVSIFCAFVAGIVWFAERHTFAELQQQDVPLAWHVQLVLSFYLSFAFLSTMFREIIKDMEDVKGDDTLHCRTLPIVFGIRRAKWVAAFFGFVLLLGLFYLSALLWTYSQLFQLAFMTLGIIAPLVTALYLLKTATTSSEFKWLSTLSKFIMLTGLILLFLL